MESATAGGKEPQTDLAPAVVRGSEWAEKTAVRWGCVEAAWSAAETGYASAVYWVFSPAAWTADEWEIASAVCWGNDSADETAS
jgi:hypothetical protein